MQERQNRELHILESPLMHGGARDMPCVEVTFASHEYDWWSFDKETSDLLVGVHLFISNTGNTRREKRLIYRVARGMYAKVYEEECEQSPLQERVETLTPQIADEVKNRYSSAPVPVPTSPVIPDPIPDPPMTEAAPYEEREPDPGLEPVPATEDVPEQQASLMRPYVKGEEYLNTTSSLALPSTSWSPNPPVNPAIPSTSLFVPSASARHSQENAVAAQHRRQASTATAESSTLLFDRRDLSQY